MAARLSAAEIAYPEKLERWEIQVVGVVSYHDMVLRGLMQMIKA